MHTFRILNLGSRFLWDGCLFLRLLLLLLLWLLSFLGLLSFLSLLSLLGLALLFSFGGLLRLLGSLLGLGLQPVLLIDFSSGHVSLVGLDSENYLLFSSAISLPLVLSKLLLAWSSAMLTKEVSRRTEA